MPYGKTTKAEREERIHFALHLICATGSSTGVWKLVCTEFGCSKGASHRYVRAAKNLVGIDLPAVTAAERCRVRRLLDEMLAATKLTSPLRLAVIGKIIDLLGLAQPTKAEVSVTSKPFDPIAAYQADPGLRDRALQLERDVAHADKTLGAIDVGKDRFAGVAVSASYPSSGNGRNGNSHKSGPEPTCN